MTTRRFRLLAAALTALGLAAHVAYWYWPRPRLGVPELAAARALLGDPERDLVVWIPFPHQNLAAIEERVGEAETWLARLATAAGAPPPHLPRFGLWIAPPARELVLAGGEGGGTVAAARVYPAVAVLMRLAGRLAGNPWLAGGEIDLGGGRTARVAWRGRVWTLTAGASLPEAPAAALPPGRPALAQVRVRRPPPPLPPGLWRLEPSADGSVVARLGEVPERLREGPPGGAEPPAAWVAETDYGPLGGPSALLLWADGGAVEGLPRAALLEAGGARPFALPGHRIARFAGVEPGREELAAVRVTAFDDASRAGARLAADWLLASFPGPAEGRPWRSFAAGADAARAARALARGASHLARLPVIGEREAARLGAAADLLAPWGGGELRLEVWREPDAAILALAGTPAR